ncbi:LbetaH domain-containing protein [Phycisphaera mikurensis]|uniref:Nucleotidyl transferase domain-containing protein n=1 Tax=Phycisphaera mikurensis (strain NBRC 102666 / KCTC 22515 / FYK2301M01) TaxID=1142394 RepID=I0IBI9_PHYMF|nr:hypothetical protein [Phycisphaera mikurensis]MBB6442842.1 hypothetical protein [Phycisphaera mikurensis]BAM02627.1 hypothetical protein PSMK_04680 [Phycisphaera mikurensis NBRC 102666]
MSPKRSKSDTGSARFGGLAPRGGQHGGSRFDDPGGDEPQGPPPRVEAVVMLAGQVRPTPLRRATGRGSLELPLAAGHTVLDHWCEQLDAYAGLHGGATPLSVRVMLDHDADFERNPRFPAGIRLGLERDPSRLRGTGGLLSDVARGYDDDAVLLVVHASQLPIRPLASTLCGPVCREADVTLLCTRDGQPSGVMLVRCSALRGLKPVGFIDLNEQALPRIAASADVRVCRTARPTTMSLRTTSGYLEALRAYHGARSGSLGAPGPFAESWRPSFQVIESGASVAPGAVIHDSAVLSGARVDAGAVVVRSVVCPGTFVAPGRHVIDTIV